MQTLDASTVSLVSGRDLPLLPISTTSHPETGLNRPGFPGGSNP